MKYKVECEHLYYGRFFENAAACRAYVDTLPVDEAFTILLAGTRQKLVDRMNEKVTYTPGLKIPEKLLGIKPPKTIREVLEAAADGSLTPDIRDEHGYRFEPSGKLLDRVPYFYEYDGEKTLTFYVR